MNKQLIRQSIRDHSAAINQLTFEINHGHEVEQGASLRGTKDELKAERTKLRKDRRMLIEELNGTLDLRQW